MLKTYELIKNTKYLLCITIPIIDSVNHTYVNKQWSGSCSLLQFNNRVYKTNIIELKGLVGIDYRLERSVSFVSGQCTHPLITSRFRRPYPSVESIMPIREAA